MLCFLIKWFPTINYFKQVCFHFYSESYPTGSPKPNRPLDGAAQGLAEPCEGADARHFRRCRQAGGRVGDLEDGGESSGPPRGGLHLQEALLLPL